MATTKRVAIFEKQFIGDTTNLKNTVEVNSGYFQEYSKIHRYDGKGNLYYVPSVIVLLGNGKVINVDIDLVEIYTTI